MFLNNTATEKKEFAPHPKGPCKGVCVEVITHNKTTGQPFSKTSMDGTVKNQLILVFQTDKKIEVEQGKLEHCVHWEWVNIPDSLANEKSKLHQLLKNWEVPIRDYASQQEFEHEVLGRPAYLVFVHVKSDKTGKTYSNMSSCTAVEDPKDAFVAVDYRPYNQKQL